MKNIILILFISLNIFKIHGQGIEKGIKIYIPNLRELFTKEITVNELAKELKLNGYVSNNQNFGSIEKELEFIYNKFKNLEESNRYINNISSSGNEDLDWMRFLLRLSSDLSSNSLGNKILSHDTPIPIVYINQRNGNLPICLDSLLKFQVDHSKYPQTFYIININNNDYCDNLLLIDWFSERNNVKSKSYLKSFSKTDGKFMEYISEYNDTTSTVIEKISIKFRDQNYVFKNNKLVSKDIINEKSRR